MNSCSLHKISFPEERCPSCIEDVTNELTQEDMSKRIHKQPADMNIEEVAIAVFKIDDPSLEQLHYINAARFLQSYASNPKSFKELVCGSASKDKARFE